MFLWGVMLTDAQVYCMTSMIYLFRPSLTAKAIYKKTAEAKLYIFIIYMIFFIKICIYSFHVWLLKTHVEAPVYGSIVLAGVLLKIGRYRLIRLIEIYYKVRVKYGYIIFRVRIIVWLWENYCGNFVFSSDIKRIPYSFIVHINLMLCRLLTFYIYSRNIRKVCNDNFSWTVFFRDILYSKFILWAIGRGDSCYF